MTEATPDTTSPDTAPGACRHYAKAIGDACADAKGTIQISADDGNTLKTGTDGGIYAGGGANPVPPKPVWHELPVGTDWAQLGNRDLGFYRHGQFIYLMGQIEKNSGTIGQGELITTIGTDEVTIAQSVTVPVAVFGTDPKDDRPKVTTVEIAHSSGKITANLYGSSGSGFKGVCLDGIVLALDPTWTPPEAEEA